MVSLQTARQLALSYEGAEEQPHFEKQSFRVRKKIFLTLDEKKLIACIKLDEIVQDIFCNIDKKQIYSVPNKWGKQGWTFIALKLIKKELFKEALTASYCHVAPKSLAEKWKKGEG
jgi:predicted DNA-binding protein (MmcQ/YjbR family)